jgi:hypothetical protein
VAQLIDSLENGIAQLSVSPVAGPVAPFFTSSDTWVSRDEADRGSVGTKLHNEYPQVECTSEATANSHADNGASQKVLPGLRYLDPETCSTTAAFSLELASFYTALLTPVSAAARLFLQQTLVLSGNLSVLGRMRLEDMQQVRAALAAYQPASPEFLPLHAARVIMARVFNDDMALLQATREGVPVLLHAFQLLGAAPQFSLLTLQQLASYASPVLAALAVMRRHEERLHLLVEVSLLYSKARVHGTVEEETVTCGRYSACRMAALSALHLDRHSDVLTLLEALSDEFFELDTPRQVLMGIALAQSGRFQEAIDVAKYFALLPEVMGPLGFDQYADADLARQPEILGSIDLDNPEEGYQYELIDMRLFPAAAHLFRFVRQTLMDTHFDPNNPFAGDVATCRATARLSRYTSSTVVVPALGDMLH